jgi:hypothetical protein
MNEYQVLVYFCFHQAEVTHITSLTHPSGAPKKQTMPGGLCACLSPPKGVVKESVIKRERPLTTVHRSDRGEWSNHFSHSVLHKHALDGCEEVNLVIRNPVGGAPCTLQLQEKRGGKAVLRQPWIVVMA